MSRRLWLKPATFVAQSFEVWSSGVCLKRGVTNTTIHITFPRKSTVCFEFEGTRQEGFGRIIELDLLGSDILNDRIQYGLLPTSLRPNTIYVCNIFNGLNCMRFGYTDAFAWLHIIEFHGRFV